MSRTTPAEVDKRKQDPKEWGRRKVRPPLSRAGDRDSPGSWNNARCSGGLAQTPGSAGDGCWFGRWGVGGRSPQGGRIDPRTWASCVDAGGVWQGKNAHVADALMNWSSWGPPLKFPLGTFKKMKRSGVPDATFRDCFRSSS